MDKRLLRNEHDKIIAGVSSGIAEYMEIDVTIIRLLFVLSTIFLFGTGVLVYIVMWIVVPVNFDPAARFSKFKDYFKEEHNPSSDVKNEPDWNSKLSQGRGLPKHNDTGRTVGGLFLLVIGLYFLMNEFNIIPFWFSLRKLWPLVFVAIGLSFIMKSKQKNAWRDWKNEQEKSDIDPEKEVKEEDSSRTNQL